MKLCSYNCGSVANFETKQGRPICCKSPNSCPENKRKNAAGLKVAYASNKRKSTLTHELPPWNKGRILFDGFGFKITAKNLKKYLISVRGHKCENCNLNEWLNQPITLELDQIS